MRNASVALVSKDAGLDFFMLDMEHGSYSFETVADIASTARAAGIGCLVRIPELAKATVSRALDCGVQGIMLPMIRSVEETQQFVGWGKYPPLGMRGITGSSAGTDYLDIGHRIPETMAETNRAVLLIAQIETVGAIDCIDQIAANPGIDALVVGPHDLSISLGVPGDIHAAAVGEAVEKVRRAAERYGKPYGMHAAQSLIDKWTDKGMRFIMNSLDVNLLRDGMRRIAEKYRATT